MQETKDQRRDFGVRLHPEPCPERPQIVERLVDHGKADVGVNHIAVDPEVEPHACQHRRGMTDGEQRHVGADLIHSVKEEDHAQQKQQVVVTGDHVLGAEIEKRDDLHPGDLLDIALVAKRHAMGKGRCADAKQGEGQHCKWPVDTEGRRRRASGRDCHDGFPYAVA